MRSADHGTTILEANDLVKHFGARVNGRNRTVRAVSGVSLTVQRGQCLGLVGESGCGKTTTGRIMVGLEDPTGGQVIVDGERLHRPGRRPDSQVRRKVQMVFQDPQASLDPKMTAAASIAEPLRVSGASRKVAAAKVSELLTMVGLDTDIGRRRPQALSGGQRQRVGIARALALDPAVVVADEPTSALDVSVRAQVVNLLRDLQGKLALGMVFISHDLSTVRNLCDKVAVMYLGRIVEQGPTSEVFDHPRHPYTRALLDAIPLPDPAVEAERGSRILEGDPPDPSSPPTGCAFRTRCSIAAERCTHDDPSLRLLDHRLVACHFPLVHANA